MLNQPKLGKGSFAGIKPAVIILGKVPEGYNKELTSLLTRSSTQKESLYDSPSKSDSMSKPSILKIQSFQVKRDQIQTPKKTNASNSVFNSMFEHTDSNDLPKA